MTYVFIIDLFLVNITDKLIKHIKQILHSSKNLRELIPDLQFHRLRRRPLRHTAGK
jgi:hypothetical protein